jgi:hypothetical protein
VTYHEVARQLATAIDQPVEYVDIPEVAARDAMLRGWRHRIGVLGGVLA